MILTFIFFAVLFLCSLASLLLLAKWKKLSKFIVLNIALIALYLFFVFIIVDHAYGFGFYFKILSCLVLHSLIIFIFSIYKFFTFKKNEKST